MSLPLILAHRGMRREAPENTIPAFEKCLTAGIDGIEFDVMLSADKIPVVIHGNDLSDHTSTYSSVDTTPLVALQSLDVRGGTIPTFESVIKLLAPSNLLLNIEIKTQPQWHNGIERRVISLIRHHHLEDRVIISSFDPIILFRCKRIAPSIRRGLLMRQRSFFFLVTWIFATLLRVYSIHPVVTHCTDRLSRLAKRRGWKVAVWTVNTEADLRRATQMGVDMIISDDPLFAKKVVTHGS